jgi:hypothetical protein
MGEQRHLREFSLAVFYRGVDVLEYPVVPILYAMRIMISIKNGTCSFSLISLKMLNKGLVVITEVPTLLLNGSSICDICPHQCWVWEGSLIPVGNINRD